MHRFGPFEVDFERRELRKGGIRLRIQEQPLRILEALLDRPGEVVTREELRDRLWADGTFVDFERSLNTAVGKLRQSLNDDADQPRFVETVARQGYRFIAPVETSGKAMGTPTIPPDTQAASKTSPRSWWPWLLAASLPAIAWMAWRPAQPDRRQDRPMVWLDLEGGGDINQPAVSSSGTRLAFVRDGKLVVRRLEQPGITVLAGTEGAALPFFSPDARWIGFFAAGKLKKIPAEGGTPVTLCDAPAGRGGAWSTDGWILAALNNAGGLRRVPETGGAPQLFSSVPDESTGHLRPKLLPGGGVVYLAAHGTGTGVLQAMRTGEPARTLAESVSGVAYSGGHLIFLRSGTLYAAPLDLQQLTLSGPAWPLVEGVSVDHFLGGEFDAAAGTLVCRGRPVRVGRGIVRIARDGGRQILKEGRDDFAGPRLSPDGKRLAYTKGGALLVDDLTRGGARMVAPDGACCPLWSPDGESVVFSSRGDIAWEGGQLNSPGDAPVPWSFSPDGRWLLFHSDQPGSGYDLWAARVERTGGVLRLVDPRALVTQPGLQAGPAVSPDGRWLAYSSDESGRVEVYVIPFAPPGTPARSGKWMVSAEGGMAPRWARNGLFYRAPGRHVMALPVANGEEFRAQPAKNWSFQRLADLAGRPAFDPTADGQSVVYVVDSEEARSTETHLRVLLNIDGELQRH